MISSKRLSPSRKNRDSGVSEIIGDILILAMTVILFSSVFVFVNAFPTPNAQTYANFSADFTMTSGNTQGYLNITHQGGQRITSSLSEVVIQIGQAAPAVYGLNAGNLSLQNNTNIPWNLNSWSIGETWDILIGDSSPGAPVSVTIINKASNSVIWSSVLNPGTQNVPPIIEKAYVTPDPAFPGQKIAIFARILPDVSNLLVTANASSIYGPSLLRLVYDNFTSEYVNNTLTLPKNLTLGVTYSIPINASGTGNLSAVSVAYVSVEQTGPVVVTAAFNPNPATTSGSGRFFNLTAYVTDSNQSAFNPAIGLGSVKVMPTSSHLMTSIKNTTTMTSSAYQDVFTLAGYVLTNVSGNVEPFAINATDVNGAYYNFSVELVIINSLSGNTSFPSKYLGPTSMSFSGFKWNAPELFGQSPASVQYNNAYAIDVSYITGSGAPGLYFTVVLQNHNTTNDLYLSDLSNLYMFMILRVKAGENIASPQSAFIVMNTTQGSYEPTIAASSSQSSPSYSNKSVTSVFGQQYITLKNNGPNELWYPSLGWPIGNNLPWYNYFELLPAAVGGVVVSSKVSFGASYGGESAAKNLNNVNQSIPTTQGGPFMLSSGGGSLRQNSLSINFLLLFGYQIPAGEQPTPSIIQSGIPLGQTLPFTAIYWYGGSGGG